MNFVSKKEIQINMIHFQIGGLCWNQDAYLGGYCRPYIIRDSITGIFDNSDSNKFSDYTIVIVNYCSGDLHAGQSTASYVDSTGNLVQHRGYENTMAVLNWITRQQGMKKGLNNKIDSLLITGSSAGAAVLFLWSQPILDRLVWDSAAVISESLIVLSIHGLNHLVHI